MKVACDFCGKTVSLNEFVASCVDCAAKFKESPTTVTNTARDEIYSDDICEYCVGCNTVNRCENNSNFVGRKLSPVA